MKIILKSLKGELTHIEVEPNQTVLYLNKILSIKEKYQQLKQIEVAKQKLIYKGQVTEDQKIIEDYKMTDGDFIVIMISQSKVPQQQIPSQVQQSVSQQNQNPIAQPLQQPVPAQSQQPVQQQVPTQQAQHQNQQPLNSPQMLNSDILMGEHANAAIEEMISMGFPRDQCVLAMRAAFNNAERAIEFLLNGIPPHILQEQIQQNQQAQQAQQAQSTQQAQQTQQTQPIQPVPSQTGMQQMSPEVIQQMMNSPQIQQLRQAILANPQILQNPQIFAQLLGFLQQSNPQLLQQIQQNPQILEQLLLGGGGQGAPQQHVVQLSQQEMNDIQMIMEMGFTKQQAAEAYLVCDKNVELAISLLFDQADKEFGQQQQFAQQTQPQQVQQQPQQQSQQQPQNQQQKDSEKKMDEVKQEEVQKDKKPQEDKKDDKKDDDDNIFS